MKESNEIVFYSTPDGDKKAEVLFQEENFWLTQKALAGLFNVNVPAVSKHLKNIFESGELMADSVISILETTAADGKIYKTKHYNPDIHHRRSIRLNGFDYSQTGAYFVTICAQNRECLFGRIADGEMMLNDAGRMVERWWGELNNKFLQSKTDEYMIMPNHIHGIIVAVGANLRVCPNQTGAHAGAPLPETVQWFKTMTTNEYIRGVKQNGWSTFPGKLWQRNYYEHVIRNENELNRIREYIVNNPMQWELDRENPDGHRDIGQAQGPVSGQTHRSAPTKDEPWRI